MAEPVKDWTTDYDLFDKSYIRDPFPVWDDVRGKCPVAHTDRWGGSWMPTRYEDLFNIARDVDHFSSRNVLVAAVRPRDEEAGIHAGEEGVPQYNVGAPPITSDPPVHTWARKLLLPPFSVTSVAKWEPLTREFCASLVELPCRWPRMARATCRSSRRRHRQHARYPAGDGGRVHRVGAWLP
jgi:cytochrome P450